MIEAVNSVLANAQLLKPSVEQASRSGAVVDVPAEVSKAPQAPYVSPFISVDFDYNKAVLQIRDSDTGDVLRQFPSESRLQQIRRTEEASSRNAELTQQSLRSQASLSQPQVQSSDLSGLNEVSQNTLSGSGVAQAQVASSALAAAQTVAQSSSSGVSVVA